MNLIFITSDASKEYGGGREEELQNSLVIVMVSHYNLIRRVVNIPQSPFFVTEWCVSSLYIKKSLELIKIKL